jgi:hypothetical protein
MVEKHATMGKRGSAPKRQAGVAVDRASGPAVRPEGLSDVGGSLIPPRVDYSARARAVPSAAVDTKAVLVARSIAATLDRPENGPVLLTQIKLAQNSDPSPPTASRLATDLASFNARIATARSTLKTDTAGKTQARGHDPAPGRREAVEIRPQTPYFISTYGMHGSMAALLWETASGNHFSPNGTICNRNIQFVIVFHEMLMG